MNIDINGTIVEFPDDLSPDDLNKAAKSAADQMASVTPSEGGSALDKIAEFGAKGPLTMAREAFSKNPEPVLDALPMAGGLAGGLAGGGTPASIPLSALGGSAGESARQLGKRALGLDAPKTSMEALSQIAKEGALNAGAEGAGVALKVAGKPIAAAVDKAVVAPFQQLLTGIPGKEWLRLSKKIGTLKPKFLGGAPSKEFAGKAIGEAEEAAGLFKSALPSNLGKDYVESTLKTFREIGTPEQLAKPDFVKEVVTTLTPQEAHTMREAVNNVLTEWVAGKNGPEYRRYTILKEALDDYMGKVSPLIRKAQAAYADSAQRSKFLSLFPKTKYGEPSLGRLGFTGMIAGGAGLSGEGDLGDRAGRVASVLALTSPISNTAVRVGANLARRVAPRGLSEILRNSRDRKEKK